MAENEMKPALTPEEWAELLAPGEHHGHLVARQLDSWRACDICSGQYAGHARAAMDLYEEPYGFTQADVDLLHGIRSYFDPLWRYANAEVHERLDSLAARIAALLPPREVPDGR